MTFAGSRTDAQKAAQSRLAHGRLVGTGYVVYPARPKPYVAFIGVRGVKRYLGAFSTRDEARAAYLAAKAAT